MQHSTELIRFPDPSAWASRVQYNACNNILTSRKRVWHPGIGPSSGICDWLWIYHSSVERYKYKYVNITTTTVSGLVTLKLATTNNYSRFKCWQTVTGNGYIHSLLISVQVKWVSTAWAPKCKLFTKSFKNSLHIAYLFIYDHWQILFTSLRWTNPQQWWPPLIILSVIVTWPEIHKKWRFRRYI